MRNNGTRPRAGHIRLRGRELHSGGRAKKPSTFLETAGEILPDEKKRKKDSEEVEERKEERRTTGEKKWHDSASRQVVRDRAETR